jgi:TusE/DsrC/DsvC family sulfur relay protein
MAIEVHGKTIETDEEGFLNNLADWNEDVATALADDEKVEMSETHWGLVDYVREYYKENQVHPTMHLLVKNLGQSLGKTFHDEKKYVKYLYELFPNDPIRELCKIAGLPKPLPTEHDG